MKFIRTSAFITFLALCLTSCASDETKIETISTGFLTDYINVNYLDAISYCTDDLAEDLLELFSEFDGEGEQVKQRIYDASRNSTFNIASISIDENAKTAEVTYELFPPGMDAPFVKHIRLSKNDRIWKITSIE